MEQTDILRRAVEMLERLNEIASLCAVREDRFRETEKDSWM